MLGPWPGPDAKLITIWQLKKLRNIKVVIQNVYTKTSENICCLLNKNMKRPLTNKMWRNKRYEVVRRKQGKTLSINWLKRRYNPYIGYRKNIILSMIPILRMSETWWVIQRACMQEHNRFIKFSANKNNKNLNKINAKSNWDNKKHFNGETSKNTPSYVIIFNDSLLHFVSEFKSQI